MWSLSFASRTGLGAAGDRVDSRGTGIGAAPLTLEQLVWKYTPDRWEDVRHLNDAELVEYLFRISNGAYTAILGQIPDERLADLADDLSVLLAKSRKGGRYHQLVNDSNGVREGRIRVAVKEARARCVILTASPQPTPPEPLPTAEPTPVDGEDSLGRALARLEVLRRKVAHDRQLLRQEMRLLQAMREGHCAEVIASREEFRRRLVVGVLGLLFAAVAGVLAICGLKS
jgi:hypothetical protein